MLVHPEIAALRDDPSSQRRIKSRMNAAVCEWIDELEQRGIRSGLERFAKGADLPNCDALDTLMRDGKAALHLFGTWQAIQLAALREEPLGEVCHAHRNLAALSTIQLASAGRVALNLVTFERQDRFGNSAPEIAQFVDRETVELVLAGAGSGLIHNVSDEAQNCAKISSQQRGLFVW